jgi:hypothetical protein
MEEEDEEEDEGKPRRGDWTLGPVEAAKCVGARTGDGQGEEPGTHGPGLDMMGI